MDWWGEASRRAVAARPTGFARATNYGIGSSAICSRRTSSEPLNWNTIWCRVVPRASVGTDLSARYATPAEW